MTALFAPFVPQPHAGELPAVVPSPFAPGPPHPLALRAAELLMRSLPGPDPRERGTMFGVLVVADAQGQVGFLRGFSGMQAGSWRVPGYVGPLFDEASRDAFWPAGEAELDELQRQIDELAHGPEVTRLGERLAAEDARWADESAVLEAELDARRRRRHEARARLQREETDPADATRLLAALEHESRVDGMSLRRARAAHRAARDELTRALAAYERERREAKARQAARSCELLEGLFAGYVVPSARGMLRPLRDLFAPAVPPGGSGDCAAPKLFAHAFRAGLRPLALAEFWWGTPPPDGGRQHGRFYPACRGKCGPVLAHMLDGLTVAPPPLFGSDRIADDEPRTVFEDQWLVVVDKPAGLLSVPGRHELLADSVRTRLAARYPNATGPLVAHRLDLDTSGLLLATKDLDTYRSVQLQFSLRELDKRYVALLDGELPRDRGDEGVIDLPLRTDVEDRPRQVHDPRTGKPAVTRWRVLARGPGRTRVELSPLTGRTHQLRVHAAHPEGLALPIVGDRLYGRPAERLMLHAEALRLRHPHTGEALSFERPAPF